MTHTQGPFTILQVGKRCEVGGFYAILPPDAPPTAYVANRDDARLYAAAPELLAALKLLSDNAITTKDVWQTVEAVIAKAEGK